MAIVVKKRISTIVLVLFLFSKPAFTLPLSRTCYTVPDDMSDLYVGEEFITAGKTSRKDIIAYNIGLTDTTSLGVYWSLLNYRLSGDESESGDAVLELWHYAGRYLNDKLDAGISITLRIPSGPDPADEEKWKNLSVGRSELKIGPVFSFRITERELLNLNLSYILRSGRDEGFYGGLNGNLKEADTYKSFFGLNPFYEDSFLSGHRLSDDYVAAACSAVTTRPYPLVIFGEIYHAFTDFQDDSGVAAAGIEGEGGSLTLISAGFKYFIRDSVFCNIYSTVNPFYSSSDYRWGYGAGINIFF